MPAQALSEPIDEWVRLGLGGDPTDAMRGKTPLRLGARRARHERRHYSG